jgi:hypothetical protein
MNTQQNATKHFFMMSLPAPIRVSSQYSCIVYEGPNELVERGTLMLWDTLITSFRSCGGKQP